MMLFGIGPIPSTDITVGYGQAWMLFLGGALTGACTTCAVGRRWFGRDELRREQIAAMMVPPRPPNGAGCISLVGAGLGDPGMLTLQAVAEIRAADLLISDKLTVEAMGESQMRALLKPECRLSVARDKRSKKRGVNISDGVQDEINDEALMAALEGKRVVRLKAGDPFIYGRGGEEILFFRKHGIECSVVAGISSVIAAPMALNVPVLMRGFADQLFVGTGSTRGDKPPDVPEYSPARTYVFLMVRRRYLCQVQSCTRDMLSASSGNARRCAIWISWSPECWNWGSPPTLPQRLSKVRLPKSRRPCARRWVRWSLVRLLPGWDRQLLSQSVPWRRHLTVHWGGMTT